MRPSSLLRSVPPVWVIVLLAVALWGGEFFRRGLWDPDEARYGYVAREMREGNHWFVPYINGKPYPDKPPLMFWLINVSSLLTGGHINSVSTRMPSLLGSILTLWVVTRLLVRWRGTEAAWRGMLALLTTFLFWQEGGWGRIDALLCGLVMLSVYFFFTSTEGPPVRREILAYLFAGLAVLAKGPIGLALPMGIFAVGSVAGGERRKLKRFHWLWGPFLALIIPGLWLLVAWLQDAPADYFGAMFGEKSFGRVTESIGHNRPFYYFLEHFPVELLPWTIFMPAALVALSDRRLKGIFLGWAAFVIVLFSLFVCKRHIYILAAYPAAAMLIGVAWDDFSRLPRRWVTGTGAAAIGLVGVLAVGVTAALFIPRVPLNRLLLIPSVLVLIPGGLLLLRTFRRERLSDRWFLTFCATFFLFQITVSAVVMPDLNGLKGPVEAARAVKARLQPDQPVYLFQQQLAIFPMYADCKGREIEDLEELSKVVSEQPHAIVIFTQKQWLELPPQYRAAGAVHEFSSGRKKLLWVEFTRQ